MRLGPRSVYHRIPTFSNLDGKKMGDTSFLSLKVSDTLYFDAMIHKYPMAYQKRKEVIHTTIYIHSCWSIVSILLRAIELN